jgi:hypothetical protein
VPLPALAGNRTSTVGPDVSFFDFVVFCGFIASILPIENSSEIRPLIKPNEIPQINETSPKKTTKKHFQTWFTRNLKKRPKNYHKRSPKSRKDTKNNDIKSTRKVDGKMELGSAMEGGRVPEDSGGPWAQYMYRSAPCLPARQVRAR